MKPSRRKTCSKRRYRDRIAALLALASTGRGSANRAETRAYPCPRCKGWHLTSQPLRKASA